MSFGKVWFVGAGPGDPELLTLKAQRLLREAAYVLYTGSLVPEVVFAGITAEVEDSKGLTLDETHEKILNHVSHGRAVVRLHTGDPCIYGAIHEQIARLHTLGVPWEVVPGVSSAFAAAAAVGAELTIPELTQTVILSRVGGRTPMPTGEALGDLAHHGTLCLYLSATLTDTITRDLVAAGVDPHTPCAVVQHASMPHQRILRCTVGTLAEVVREARVREQAMILIGPALDPDLKNHPGAHESRLYASDFSHRFRRARPATEQP